MKFPALIMVIAIILSGCASALNLRNAEAHAQAGYVAQKNGDWQNSMRQFAMAVVNADLGDADVQGKSIVNYEHGRSLGVLCKYEDAEKYLLRSKTLKEQLNQSPYLALYELGSLSETQAKYSASATYFAQLIPEIQKEGLERRYPLGVADVYDRYATALEKSGKTADALVFRNKSNTIRAENPDAKPFGAPTPYGTQCNN